MTKLDFGRMSKKAMNANSVGAGERATAGKRNRFSKLIQNPTNQNFVELPKYEETPKDLNFQFSLVSTKKNGLSVDLFW